MFYLLESANINITTGPNVLIDPTTTDINVSFIASRELIFTLVTLYSIGKDSILNENLNFFECLAQLVCGVVWCD